MHGHSFIHFWLHVTHSTTHIHHEHGGGGALTPHFGRNVLRQSETWGLPSELELKHSTGSQVLRQCISNYYGGSVDWKRKELRGSAFRTFWQKIQLRTYIILVVKGVWKCVSPLLRSAGGGSCPRTLKMFIRAKWHRHKFVKSMASGSSLAVHMTLLIRLVCSLCDPVRPKFDLESILTPLCWLWVRRYYARAVCFGLPWHL